MNEGFGVELELDPDSGQQHCLFGSVALRDLADALKLFADELDRTSREARKELARKYAAAT